MTTVTTQTTERVPAATPRTWEAREVRRLCQLPLDSDDPAPARVEACITKLENKVKDLPADGNLVVTEEEDEILKDIQRCEGRG